MIECCRRWTCMDLSVRELIYCLGRMNFEYLFYKKKLCFLHSLRGCNNVTVSSVMEVFVRSEQYRKTYDFANVKPCDDKDKITYCLRLKFADTIQYNTIIQFVTRSRSIIESEARAVAGLAEVWALVN